MDTADTSTVERPRHPVVRRGEREPISPYKRRLIYERDGFACQWCGTRALLLQLDHVTPWSAGGSDRSDNLRALCGPCNDERSNFVDDLPPRLVGITAACYWCAHRRDHLPEHLLGVDTEYLDRIRAYCALCGTTSWVPAENWII